MRKGKLSAMLKHSRKRLYQRTRKLLPKHGAETLAKAGRFSSTTHGVTHMPTAQRSSQQSSSDAPEARSTEK